MTATCVFDVFSSLDGLGSAGGRGTRGPGLLAHGLAFCNEDRRTVSGAAVHREFVQMLVGNTNGINTPDASVTRMSDLPETVISASPENPLGAALPTDPAG